MLIVMNTLGGGAFGLKPTDGGQVIISIPVGKQDSYHHRRV